MGYRNLSFSYLKRSILSLLLVSMWFGACVRANDPRVTPTPKATVTVQTLTPTPTSTPSSTPTFVVQTPTVTNTVPPTFTCALGLGLRQETVDILLGVIEHPGMIMAASSNMSEDFFPDFQGWTRVLSAPSLENLQAKAERADQNGVPYEVLGYGLETSATTPEEEWQDLVGSTERAREIANRFNKKLLMGPGFRIMSQNEELYAPMAAIAEIWMLQTQRLQVYSPDQEYRSEVERIVGLIKSGNPAISVWAQINFLPDREPDALEWLAYQQAIHDLVDGAYIGVYNWDSVDHEIIVAAINSIYSTLCRE